MAGTNHRDVVERLYGHLSGHTLEEDVLAHRDDDRSWRWIAGHLAAEWDIELTDMTLIRWYSDRVEATTQDEVS